MTQQIQAAGEAFGPELDDEAFQRLYERYNRPIYNFFVNRGFSREESRDLVQETFLAAYESSASFRGEARLEVWLFGIAANVWRTAVRQRRRLKRDAEVISLDLMTPDDPSRPAVEVADAAQKNRQLERYLADEQIRQLHDALADLPKKMRLCVVLRLREDLKYREIADVLKVSINTVRTQLFDARKKLRVRLADYFPDPP